MNRTICQAAIERSSCVSASQYPQGDFRAPVPVIDPGHSYRASPTSCRTWCSRRTRRWRGSLITAIGFSLLMVLMVSLGVPARSRASASGATTSPVGWAFDIINFVWWIGIGHAGTLISADPAALQAGLAHVDQPVRRGDDALRRGLRGDLPDLPHRPSVAGRLLAVPVSEHDGRCGRTSAARCIWDVFAVSTYGTVSALFWFVGLIPDLATFRDRAEQPGR